MAKLEHTTEGKIYLTGHFIKQGVEYRTWRKRYFILNGTKLTYHLSEDDIVEKGSIDLTKGFGVRNKIETMGLGGVEWPSHVDNDLAFGIAVDGRTYYLYGESKEEVEKWKTILQQIINKHGNPNKHSYKDPQGPAEQPLSKIIRNATKLSQKITHTPKLRKTDSSDSYKGGGPMTPTGGPMTPTGGPMTPTGGPMTPTGGPMTPTGGPMTPKGEQDEGSQYDLLTQD